MAETNENQAPHKMVAPLIYKPASLASQECRLIPKKKYKHLFAKVRDGMPLNYNEQRAYGSTLRIATFGDESNQLRERLVATKSTKKKKEDNVVVGNARLMSECNVFLNLSDLLRIFYADPDRKTQEGPRARARLVSWLTQRTFNVSVSRLLDVTGIWPSHGPPNWNMIRCLPDFAKDPVGFMERYNKQQSQQQTLAQPQAQTGQQQSQYVFNNGAVPAGAIFVAVGGTYRKLDIAEGGTFTKVEVANGVTYIAKSYGSSHKKRDKRAPHHRRRRGNKYSRKSPVRSPMTFSGRGSESDRSSSDEDEYYAPLAKSRDTNKSAAKESVTKKSGEASESPAKSLDSNELSTNESGDASESPAKSLDSFDGLDYHSGDDYASQDSPAESSPTNESATNKSSDEASESPAKSSPTDESATNKSSDKASESWDKSPPSNKPAAKFVFNFEGLAAAPSPAIKRASTEPPIASELATAAQGSGLLALKPFGSETEPSSFDFGRVKPIASESSPTNKSATKSPEEPLAFAFNFDGLAASPTIKPTSTDEPLLFDRSFRSGTGSSTFIFGGAIAPGKPLAFDRPFGSGTEAPTFNFSGPIASVKPADEPPLFDRPFGSGTESPTFNFGRPIALPTPKPIASETTGFAELVVKPIASTKHGVKPFARAECTVKPIAKSFEVRPATVLPAVKPIAKPFTAANPFTVAKPIQGKALDVQPVAESALEQPVAVKRIAEVQPGAVEPPEAAKPIQGQPPAVKPIAELLAAVELRQSDAAVEFDELIAAVNPTQDQAPDVVPIAERLAVEPPVVAEPIVLRSSIKPRTPVPVRRSSTIVHIDGTTKKVTPSSLFGSLKTTFRQVVASKTHLFVLTIEGKVYSVPNPNYQGSILGRMFTFGAKPPFVPCQVDFPEIGQVTVTIDFLAAFEDNVFACASDGNAYRLVVDGDTIKAKFFEAAHDAGMIKKIHPGGNFCIMEKYNNLSGVREWFIVGLWAGAPEPKRLEIGKKIKDGGLFAKQKATIIDVSCERSHLTVSATDYLKDDCFNLYRMKVSRETLGQVDDDGNTAFLQPMFDVAHVAEKPIRSITGMTANGDHTIIYTPQGNMAVGNVFEKRVFARTVPFLKGFKFASVKTGKKFCIVESSGRFNTRVVFSVDGFSSVYSVIQLDFHETLDKSTLEVQDLSFCPSGSGAYGLMDMPKSRGRSLSFDDASCETEYGLDSPPTQLRRQSSVPTDFSNKNAY